MEYLDYFENYRTNLVTIIGYLIGIKEDVLYDEKLQFNLETLKEISNDVKCNIIRHLSIIRMDYIRNFKQISNGQFNLQPLETMTDYICFLSYIYELDFIILLCSSFREYEFNMIKELAKVNIYTKDDDYKYIY